MEYLPIFLSFVAVIVGVRGDTWDGDQSGFRKLTYTGLLALVIALVSTGLSFYSTAMNQQERTAYRQAAFQDMSLAVDQLLSPYRALFLKYKGPSFLQSSTPTDEATALQQLNMAIPADNLISDNFTSFLATIDVMSPSGDIRSGERLPYLDHIALRTAEGSARLNLVLQRGADLLPTDVRTVSAKLFQTPYIAASSARPSVLRHLPQNVRRTILPPKSSSEESIVLNYIAFVQLADSLRRLAEKP